jgi:hypothetical protein
VLLNRPRLRLSALAPMSWFESLVIRCLRLLEKFRRMGAVLGLRVRLRVRLR